MPSGSARRRNLRADRGGARDDDSSPVNPRRRRPPGRSLFLASDTDSDPDEFRDSDSSPDTDVDMRRNSFSYDSEDMDDEPVGVRAPAILAQGGNGAAQDSDSEDGIEVLEEAPANMRPPHPPTPIELLDSDDDDSIDVPPRPPRPAKHPRSPSWDILSSPPPPKRRHPVAPQLQDEAPMAGPSRQAVVTVDVDDLIPLVLDVMPDLCTDWLRTNLRNIMETLKDKTATPGQQAVEQVMNMALEMDSYPKAGDKDKAPEGEKDEGDYKSSEYRARDRRGPEYCDLSLSLLETLFQQIPVAFIRDSFRDKLYQLVPVYIHLKSLAALEDKPYKEMKKPRMNKLKTLAKLDDRPRKGDADNGLGALEFYREYAFLKTFMKEAAEKERLDLEAAAAKAQAEEERTKRREAAVAAGRSQECGCCFDSEAVEDMVACDQGHLFCQPCITSFAENKLGENQTTMTCMHTSGCQATFSDAVLESVLSGTTMSLYHRLRQTKDLEMANIEGLESCPYCPFSMIIENPDEKLFRCLKADCKKITCRKCKRPDHIPKRCEEVEAEFKLDKRHAVEEAMSAALMRRCPKCSKPYLKESGCNKITCQNCRTVSCYICQKEIPEEYGHFDQFPGRYHERRDTTKCQLWDRGDENTAEQQRIIAARDEALKKVREAAAAGGVNIEDEDINVEAPEPAPRPAGPYYRGFPYNPLGAGGNAGMPDLQAEIANLRGLRAELHALRGGPLANMPHIPHIPQDHMAAIGARARAALDAARVNRAERAGQVGAIRDRHARQQAQADHDRHLGNEIAGFGRLLAEHHVAMDAHQRAVIEHGHNIVEQMRRLAPPVEPQAHLDQLLQLRGGEALARPLPQIGALAAAAAPSVPGGVLAEQLAAVRARIYRRGDLPGDAEAAPADLPEDHPRVRIRVADLAPLPAEAGLPRVPAPRPRRAEREGSPDPDLDEAELHADQLPVYDDLMLRLDRLRPIPDAAGARHALHDAGRALPEVRHEQHERELGIRREVGEAAVREPLRFLNFAAIPPVPCRRHGHAQAPPAAPPGAALDAPDLEARLAAIPQRRRVAFAEDPVALNDAVPVAEGVGRRSRRNLPDVMLNL